MRRITAGLVRGKELHRDSTDIAANASGESLQARFAGKAHLARLFSIAVENGGDDHEWGHRNQNG